MAENIIQASDSLIEAHKCLNDPRYKQIADNKKENLMIGIPKSKKLI